MINSLDTQRMDLINAAIPFVLQHGWCPQALLEASVSLKEDLRYWGILFPDISSVVEFFARSEDRRMLVEIQKLGEIDGVRNKISKALFARIVNISGGTKMLKRLEEFYFGIHAPLAAQNIWQTADIIWLFAGDKSTDFNYYTKRTLLLGVYIAVVRKYMVDAEDIEQYISDSLDIVVQFGNFKKHLQLPKIEDIPILRMFS
jgi:ubiquinone biosynthesis protein COQ9